MSCTINHKIQVKVELLFVSQNLGCSLSCAGTERVCSSCVLFCRIWRVRGLTFLFLCLNFGLHSIPYFGLIGRL